MRKALFTLLIICTSSLTSDLIPETSALEDVDGRDFSNRQTSPGMNTKISPSLTEVLDKMAGAAALRNGAEGLSAEDFSTPLVKVDDVTDAIRGTSGNRQDGTVNAPPAHVHEGG